MSARKPDHGEAAEPSAPQAKTTTAGRPLKDPVPAAACGTCLVAIHGDGSPDLAARVAGFTADHPPGVEHVWVRRLPKQKGDPQ